MQVVSFMLLVFRDGYLESSKAVLYEIYGGTVKRRLGPDLCFQELQTLLDTGTLVFQGKKSQETWAYKNLNIALMDSELGPKTPTLTATVTTHGVEVRYAREYGNGVEVHEMLKGVSDVVPFAKERGCGKINWVDARETATKSQAQVAVKQKPLHPACLVCGQPLYSDGKIRRLNACPACSGEPMFAPSNSVKPNGYVN